MSTASVHAAITGTHAFTLSCLLCAGISAHHWHRVLPDEEANDPAALQLWLDSSRTELYHHMETSHGVYLS